MRKIFRSFGLSLLVGLLLVTAAAPFVADGTARAAGRDDTLRSYADVADLAMPSVVNISTDKVVENNIQHPFLDDPFFRRFFNMPDDEFHGRGGNERVEHSLGSGIVISTDGYILTNNHVVENADKIRVIFEEDREYEAEVIGTDPPTDVALIKIDADDLPAIEIADSKELRIGDQVMAIGNPFGVGQTVTMGIVSALGRNIGMMQYADLIQTDAAINPGNSGGALVNMRGELVGMNAAIVTRSGGSEGVGFAIPTSMAIRVVESLKRDGSVQRAYLGVLPQQVDQSLADYYGMERPRGVLIAQVNDDTPAAKAGLKDGDIILTVDGTEIKNPSMLRNVISLSEVGHKAKLEILRDGKEKDITVKLDEYPDNQVANNTHEHDNATDDTLEGVQVQVLNDRIRSMAGLPDDMSGLIVTDVQATSNAAREGLAKGDVIQEVGRESITSLKDFKEALGKNKDRPVFMRVYKPRQQRSIFMAVPR